MKRLNFSVLKIIEEKSVSFKNTNIVLFSRNTSFDSCTFNKKYSSAKSNHKINNVHNVNIANYFQKTPNRKFLYINNSLIKNKESLAKKFSFETENNVNNMKSNELTSKPNKDKFLPIPTSSVTENTMMTSCCEHTRIKPFQNTNILNKENLESNRSIKLNITEEKHNNNYEKSIPRLTKKYKTNQISVTQEKKLKSLKLWQKARNFQKIYTGIIHPRVYKLEGDHENEIKEFLYIPKKKVSKSDTKVLHLKNNIFAENKEDNNQDEEIKNQEKFEKLSETQKEYIRIRLKSKACQLITDGIENNDNIEENQLKIIQKFEKLFKANPEKNKYCPDNKNFLFNQKLPDGKTLLYTACQEGNTTIVNYLLKKQLDVNIKVTYGGLDDNCLAVASRWGYYDIVKLLLECGRIKYKYVVQVYNDSNVKSEIKKLIKFYIPKVSKKKHKKRFYCC